MIKPRVSGVACDVGTGCNHKLLIVINKEEEKSIQLCKQEENGVDSCGSVEHLLPLETASPEGIPEC